MTESNWAIEVSLDDAVATHDFGRRLGAQVRAGDLIVLSGPLGAGKTTLTRGIGEGLGIRGPVTSPTFVLARTHPSEVGGPPMVHVDAYRLADARELDDLDIDFEQSVAVVEWGLGMLDGAVDSWLEIQLERLGGTDLDLGEVLDADEPRRLTVRGFGPRWSAPLA